MPDFDHDRNKPPASAPLSAGVWSVAALSAAAFLCSVLTAKLLARMVDHVGASAVAQRERSLRDLANVAPSAQAPQAVTIFRRIGVDGVATATIPNGKTAPLKPCGESK